MQSASHVRAGGLGHGPGLLGVLLVVVFGLALRLYNLGLQSVWLDEAHTHERAVMRLSDTIAASIAQHHVPTYFAFMHYWVRAFGDDEVVLRLPSAIFGALTIAAAAGLGHVLAGARTGVLTALLTAIAPLQVRYAQEARMYTMLTFAATVALTGLAWLARHPDEAARPLSSSRSKRLRASSSGAALAWAAYVLGTIAALYLHDASVILWATSGLAALAIVLGRREGRLRFAFNFSLANAIVLAAWAPYLQTFLRQAQAAADDFWATFPTGPQQFEILRRLYLFGVDASWFGALVFVLVVASAWASRKDLRVMVVLVLGWVVPPALLLLVSVHTPMFLPRLVLWSAIPLFALLARGACAVPHPAGPAMAVCVIVYAAYPVLSSTLETEYKTPLRTAAEVIARSANEAPLVLVTDAHARLPLRYYAVRRTEPLLPGQVDYLTPEQAARPLRAWREVWLVDALFAPAPRYLGALGQHGKLISTEHVSHRLQLYRFDLADAADAALEGSPPDGP